MELLKNIAFWAWLVGNVAVTAFFPELVKSGWGQVPVLTVWIANTAVGFWMDRNW